MPMFFHWGCRTCRVSNWTTAGRECRAQSDGLNSVYLSPSRSKHPCCTLSKDLKRRCCSIYKLYMYNFLNFLRNVLLTVACLISMYIVAGLYCYYWLHKFVMCDSTCILLVFLVRFSLLVAEFFWELNPGSRRECPFDLRLKSHPQSGRDFDIPLQNAGFRPTLERSRFFFHAPIPQTGMCFFFGISIESHSGHRFSITKHFQDGLPSPTTGWNVFFACKW